MAVAALSTPKRCGQVVSGQIRRWRPAYASGGNRRARAPSIDRAVALSVRWGNSRGGADDSIGVLISRSPARGSATLWIADASSVGRRLVQAPVNFLGQRVRLTVLIDGALVGNGLHLPAWAHTASGARPLEPARIEGGDRRTRLHSESNRANRGRQRPRGIRENELS